MNDDQMTEREILNYGDDDEEEFSEQSEPLYKSSPFFQRYLIFLQEAIDHGIESSKNKSLRDNKFYNINFAKAILKKHIAFLPLMAHFFTSFYYEDESFKRPNNSYVEKNHSLLKKHMNDEFCGNLGRIRLDDYLKAEQKYLKLKFLEILEASAVFDIYGRKIKKSQKKNLSMENLRERWRGKPKPALFYNKKDLTKQISNLIYF